MTVQPPWLITARAELGTKEIAGPDDHPRIVEYHSYTDLASNDDEVAWCSSFINFCVARSMGFSSPEEWLAQDIPGTGKANARSWLDWGRKMEVPAHGCVTVLWRQSRDSWMGHVGLLVAIDRYNVSLLGGNQKNCVNVTPYSIDRVLGFRWRE